MNYYKIKVGNNSYNYLKIIIEDIDNVGSIFTYDNYNYVTGTDQKNFLKENEVDFFEITKEEYDFIYEVASKNFTHIESIEDARNAFLEKSDLDELSKKSLQVYWNSPKITLNDIQKLF